MSQILSVLYEDVYGEPAADDLLLIVVGTSLEAELTDRALAYHVRERVYERYARPEAAGRALLRPVVCTDVWYVSESALRTRPTLAIGRPETNAATAMLARSVPTRFIADDRYRIQLDAECIDVHACLWGIDARSTSDAVERFVDHHLEEWLSAIDDREA